MDLQDFDVHKPASHEPPPTRRYPWIWVAAGIIIVVALAAWFATRREAPEPDRVAVTDVSPAPPAPVEKSATLGGNPYDVEVPPLADSDPLVRELVRKLSSNPTLAAWLTTDNLLRRFTAGVHNIAAGRSPAAHARHVTPPPPFTATTKGNAAVMDARSYARYDTFAAAVGSIDAGGAARLYATLRPRLEEASSELGSGSSFDATLERALYVLLQTPVVEGPIALRSKGANYAYADPKLEQLTGAQKHLLRMGPRNMRAIQGKLREIARELGIPAERLPDTAS
jgi:hypothetical protein